jgi:hypothetical protein
MYEIRGDLNAVDGAIEEQGESFRSAIPDHPGELMPSPGGLLTAYRQAASEIYQMRNAVTPTDAYSAAMQDAAFWALYSAAAEGCSAVVGEHHPGWREKVPALRDMHVIASGPGSGKSTLAMAFAAALQRVSGAEPYPLGSVFLVHHIETANRVYQELSTLLPGKVAVFSTKHDAERDQGYPNRYAVTDLETFPVLVVTHEFYMGLRGERAQGQWPNPSACPDVHRREGKRDRRLRHDPGSYGRRVGLCAARPARIP